MEETDKSMTPQNQSCFTLSCHIMVILPKMAKRMAFVVLKSKNTDFAEKKNANY